MTSYTRDNFERFGNYLSIDVMRSSICNAKEFCYIDPVVLNEIGKINVVCEGFVITETHDAYNFFKILIPDVNIKEQEKIICNIF